MKTGSQNFLCTGHLNWRTCGSISSSLSPTRQENAGLPSRHHWLGSEEHFKEFFMGFQRFKSLALKWSLEDFSTMIQIWMKNGVKKTPLIKRFTTMPIIRAERKLNKTFTSQKRVKFHSPQECQKFLSLSVAKMQLSQYNFQVDNWAIFFRPKMFDFETNKSRLKNESLHAWLAQFLRIKISLGNRHLKLSE